MARWKAEDRAVLTHAVSSLQFQVYSFKFTVYKFTIIKSTVYIYQVYSLHSSSLQVSMFSSTSSSLNIVGGSVRRSGLRSSMPPVFL